MNLHEYVSRHSQTGLAKLVGKHVSFVNQWVSGTRPIPVIACVEIEQKTGGEVTRQELRPDDWHLIWPELRATPQPTTEPAAASV